MFSRPPGSPPRAAPGHYGLEGGREVHCQQAAGGGVGIAAGGLGVAVGVGEIGLDVEDGGAVHQIRPGYDQVGADVRGGFHGDKADAGEA